MTLRHLSKSLALYATLAATAAQANPLVDAVRQANDRFKDPAVATAEGYTPIPCASAPDGGGMGVHYVNAEHFKDEVPDIPRPQAIMYEPQADGSMQLIGVEYFTFKGPASLAGHLLHFRGAPNRYGLEPFYEMHVWAWKENPRGPFADDNPDVSCENMPVP